MYLFFMQNVELVDTHGNLVGSVEAICDADTMCKALVAQTGIAHMVRWVGNIHFGYYVRAGEVRRVSM